MKLRPIVLYFVLCLSTVLFVGNAKAGQGVEMSLEERINIAGRQGMVIQEVAKLACFARLEQSKVGIEQVDELIGRYDTTLRGLMRGSKELGLEKESDADVIVAMKEASSTWQRFVFAVKFDVQRGVLSDKAFDLVVEQNLALTQDAEAITQAMSKSYGLQEMHPELAHALNVATHQRMLLQRIVKDVCLTQIAGFRSQAQQDLMSSVQEFDATLTDLIEGNQAKDIVSAPTWDLAAQLEYVGEIWRGYASVLDTAQSGHPLSTQDLTEIQVMLEKTLPEMENAIWMYASF